MAENTHDDVKQRTDERLQADQKAAAAHQKANDERENKMREAAKQKLEDRRKLEDEELERLEKRLDERKKYNEARRKENERRAALSPDESLAEDEKRAAMTPEERVKDDEAKGLVLSPEQYAEINPLAATYPIQTEKAHPTEMILSEANGQRSRAYAYFAGATTIAVGQMVKQTVAPTTTTPGTFVAAAVGADCTAIALYGGTGDATNGLRIAVLVRDAEVNGNCLNWGAITAPEQAIGLTTLAGVGIIARY